MAKSKTAEEKKMSPQQFAMLALEHIKLKQDEKMLRARIDKVRKEVDAAAPHFVVEEPSTGHKEWVGEHAGQKVRVQYQKRTSSELVPDALDLLKANGLGEGDQPLFETIEQVRVDRLESAIRNKEISPSLAAQLYNTHSTYSLIIKTEV